MPDKKNHSDFLREQEDKKQKTLNELQDLRNLLGKQPAQPTDPITQETQTFVPSTSAKPSLDDTQVLSAASSDSNTIKSQDTVLIETDIYRKAKEEQERQEELARQARIRQTSAAQPKRPEYSEHSEYSEHKTTVPPTRGEGGTVQPNRKITRAEATKRRKAKAKRRMMLTGVVALILVIILAAAIHTVVTAKNSKNAIAAGSGVVADGAKAAETNVVTTESGQKIDWDNSKPASEQITEQYLAIKDNPDAAEYQKLYPGMYSDARSVATEESESKTCYLTFDDGPAETVTPDILDTLKQYGVKATFFVVANSVENNPDIVKRIVDEGHTLCIHANLHDYNTIYQSVDSYLEDFAKAYDIIYETTGYRVQGFRFPGGSNNGIITSEDGLYQKITSEMIRRGFDYYDWNAYDGDAEGSIPEPSSLASRAVEEANQSSRNDVILLMHDTYGKENTAAALPSIIEGLQNDGFDILPITNSTRPVHFYVNDYTPSEYSLEAEESTDGETAE